MSAQSRKRRAQRRAAHAKGLRHVETSETAGAPDGRRRRWERLLPPQADGGLSWGRKAVVTAAAVAVGAAVGPVLTPGQETLWGSVAGASVALAVLSSVAGVRRLRPRWGTAASIALVCLAWTAAGIAVALIPPDCPGGYDAGRCGIAETATYSMIGALTPLSVVMLVFPAVVAWRGARLVWRRWGAHRAGSVRSTLWLRGAASPRGRAGRP